MHFAIEALRSELVHIVLILANPSDYSPLMLVADHKVLIDMMAQKLSFEEQREYVILVVGEGDPDPFPFKIVNLPIPNVTLNNARKNSRKNDPSA